MSFFKETKGVANLIKDVAQWGQEIFIPLALSQFSDLNYLLLKTHTNTGDSSVKANLPKNHQLTSLFLGVVSARGMHTYIPNLQRLSHTLFISIGFYSAHPASGLWVDYNIRIKYKI